VLQITHLTPEGLKESVSTSFASIFEAGAERVCTLLLAYCHFVSDGICCIF